MPFRPAGLKVSMKERNRVLIALLLHLGVLPAGAITTNLTVAADTFITSGSPGDNAGANPWFDAGTDGEHTVRRGLLRFDLTRIPPGSMVSLVTLRLNVTKVPGYGARAVDSNFDLFRLTSGWNEGAQIGSIGNLAKPGEVTWNSRMQSYQPWSQPGAKGDVASTASASTATSTNTGPMFWAGPGLVQDVQLWVNQPALNMGWLLISDKETTPRTVRGFAARESGSNAGKLQITYTPPPGPNPSTITSIVLSNKFPSSLLSITNVPVITNGLVTLSWAGDTNGKFDLLFSSDLGTNVAWGLAQPNIPADPSGLTVVSDPPYLSSPAYPSNQALFYRVASLPSTPSMAVRQQVLISNLVAPSVLTHAGDGSRRRFIADQPGQIWIVDRASNLLSAPFLDISPRVTPLDTNYDERGLLGLAFHPGYSTNGRFFVYYSAPSQDPAADNLAVLSEFKVSAGNSNLADVASERVLMAIAEPQSNNEGGAVVFGPDGYLYVGVGDGGGAADQHGPYGNSQELTNLLGKILRIDVDSGVPYGIPADNPFVMTPEARPEIYAYGLRNPARFSFDRSGGRLGFVADIGQSLWEEVDIVRSGANYGWRIMEGTHIFDPTVATALGVDIASLDQPIIEYQNGPSGISVVGGFVYRGFAFPDLTGKYVFGDFSTSLSLPDGQLYYLAETRPGIWERFSFQLYPDGARLGRFVKGFGEDELGELYLLSSTSPGPAGTTGDVRHLVRP
jgi:glucose/arabinose dehydrogenase